LVNPKIQKSKNPKIQKSCKSWFAFGDKKTTSAYRIRGLYSILKVVSLPSSPDSSGMLNEVGLKSFARLLA